jgi:hypothetical protein
MYVCILHALGVFLHAGTIVEFTPRDDKSIDSVMAALPTLQFFLGLTIHLITESPGGIEAGIVS